MNRKNIFVLSLNFLSLALATAKLYFSSVIFDLNTYAGYNYFYQINNYLIVLLGFGIESGYLIYASSLYKYRKRYYINIERSVLTFYFLLCFSVFLLALSLYLVFDLFFLVNLSSALTYLLLNLYITKNRIEAKLARSVAISIFRNIVLFSSLIIYLLAPKDYKYLIIVENSILFLAVLWLSSVKTISLEHVNFNLLYKIIKRGIYYSINGAVRYFFVFFDKFIFKFFFSSILLANYLFINYFYIISSVFLTLYVQFFIPADIADSFKSNRNKTKMLLQRAGVIFFSLLLINIAIFYLIVNFSFFPNKFFYFKDFFAYSFLGFSFAAASIFDGAIVSIGQEKKLLFYTAILTFFSTVILLICDFLFLSPDLHILIFTINRFLIFIISLLIFLKFSK